MQYNAILIKSLQASGAVSAKRFVDFNGRQIDSAGKGALGIALYDADDGEAVPVVVLGTAVVESGGIISVGDYLTSDANGKAITATTGQTINAIALSAASGAGQEIEVLLVSPVTTA